MYIYIYDTYIYMYGGFLKWGYPQSSSILVGWSIINHPAIGVLPFMQLPIYLSIYLYIYIVDLRQCEIQYLVHDMWCLWLISTKPCKTISTGEQKRNQDTCIRHSKTVRSSAKDVWTPRKHIWVRVYWSHLKFSAGNWTTLKDASDLAASWKLVLPMVVWCCFRENPFNKKSFNNQESSIVIYYWQVFQASPGAESRAPRAAVCAGLFCLTSVACGCRCSLSAAVSWAWEVTVSATLASRYQ